VLFGNVDVPSQDLQPVVRHAAWKEELAAWRAVRDVRPAA
jgi:hypothetical protein